jgi:hypothetical protein
MIRAVAQKDIAYLCGLVWKLCSTNRINIALEVIQELRLDRSTIRTLIEAIPDEPIDCPELKAIVAQLLLFLPKSLVDSVGTQPPRLPGWDDDTALPEGRPAAPLNDTDNIWVEKAVEPGCVQTSDTRRAAFLCYTCKQRPEQVCLNCAVHCHAGHNVLFGGSRDFECRCAKMGQCGGTKRQPEGPPLSAPKLLKLFLSLFNSDKPAGAVEVPSRPLSPRLAKDPKSMLFRAMKWLTVPSRIGYAIVRPSLFTPRSVNVYCDQALPGVLKRPIALHLLESCGGLLFVAAGRHMKVFRGFEEVRQFDVPPPTVVKARRCNDIVVLAVGSFGRFDVFQIDAEGHERRLFHDARDGTSVVQIEFPRDEHVAALWGACLAIYHIEESEQRLSPVEICVCGVEIMTSCVFRPKDGLTFALVGMATGKTAIEPVLVGSGPKVELTTFVRWPSNRLGLWLSFCEEMDLFFVSAPTSELQVYQMDDIFTEIPLPKASIGGVPGELAFCCRLPDCKSILLFVHPPSGALYALEFTDDAIELSRVPQSGKGFSFFGRDQAVYGLTVMDDQVLVLANDGSLKTFVQSDRDDSDDNFGVPYAVPLTFWTGATIATPENSEITGTDNSQNYATLYHDSPAYFRNPPSERVLTFHVSDPSYAIVGLVIAFAHRDPDSRPPYAILHGRRIPTRQDPISMFPLMPHEVRPGEKVDLYFTAPQSPEIAMQSAWIFIVKSDRIRRFIEVDMSSRDWMTQPSDLLDFIDGGDAEDVVYPLAMAIDPKSTDLFDPEPIKKLAQIIYSRQSWSLPARSAMVRIASANGAAIAWWAEGIRAVIESGAVDERLWEALWRDFALLPQDIQRAIQDTVWSADPPVASVGAALSAFSYHD